MEQHFANGVVIVIAGPAQDAPQARENSDSASITLSIGLSLSSGSSLVSLQPVTMPIACCLPGHAHARAGHRLHAGRQQIVEGAGEGTGKATCTTGMISSN